MLKKLPVHVGNGMVRPPDPLVSAVRLKASNWKINMTAMVSTMNVCLRTRSSRKPIGIEARAQTRPAAGSRANRPQPPARWAWMAISATVYCPRP